MAVRTEQNSTAIQQDDSEQKNFIVIQKENVVELGVKNELLSPCGLYCGVCGVYMASRDNNQKLKEKFAGAYGVSLDQIKCKGCLSDEKFVFCQICGIRTCVTEKNIEGCHCCDDFPCKQIDDFPVAVGKRVILRSVPDRRKLGNLKWIESEESRYKCPHCNNDLFRGAKRCGSCKEAVKID